MSRRPVFTDDALRAAIGPRAPLSLSREGRIRLIGETAKALLAGRMPSKSAALFVGGALDSWLREGGRLERDFFKVLRPRSHYTVARAWAKLEAQNSEAEGRDDPEELP